MPEETEKLVPLKTIMAVTGLKVAQPCIAVHVMANFQAHISLVPVPSGGKSLRSGHGRMD
jgi:hypothetical protein